MALVGFELLFQSIRDQLRSNDDAAIAVVHWNLISKGLKCCGTGDTWPNTQSENNTGDEALPLGWNQDNSIYTLRYLDPASNGTYLMKALAMDGSLILHLVRCFDEKTVSMTIQSRDYVTDSRESMARSYRALSVLNNQLDKELYGKMINTKSRAARSSTSDTTASSSKRHSSSQDPPERSPPMFDPPRRPGSYDPFNIGGADLDPFGRGGGMFMDPRNFPQAPRGIMPQPQPGFPLGSVPPGARFDPVGPPGVRPQPDPDHERRPSEYDDMFM
ncbi:hypothetical protein RRG08_013759 [Elysia crispata]|uniref:Proteasome inhibitor PI31 subunit n=1 Tax=Elysia crispata TaxID=231223 RepID=A0AAE0ZR99_9GAST|nr:hypothetical protein RRG08_013759 [Elysia crispata]